MIGRGYSGNSATAMRALVALNRQSAFELLTVGNFAQFGKFGKYISEPASAMSNSTPSADAKPLRMTHNRMADVRQMPANSPGGSAFDQPERWESVV